MIKKYLEFINEDEDFDSFGEWVESHIDDDYVKNIVSRYTQDADPSIDLSNAINILDERTKSDIKNQIDEYLENGIEEKEPDILASVDIDSIDEAYTEEITISGKGIFVSFLKSLTGLGQKEAKPDWEKCPNNFILFYYFPNLDAQYTKQVLSRFKSLVRYSDYIDYGKNEVNLYFGIKCDGQFEYGISYGELIPFGQFKMSLSTIRWMCKIDSKSAASLKKEVVNLNYVDILLLGKIKIDMETFNPGFFEKKIYPMLNDRTYSFGYGGFGKWDNGKIDPDVFLTARNNFNNWIIAKKWGSKVLINVEPGVGDFTVYFNIKLK